MADFTSRQRVTDSKVWWNVNPQKYFWSRDTGNSHQLSQKVFQDFFLQRYGKYFSQECPWTQNKDGCTYKDTHITHNTLWTYCRQTRTMECNDHLRWQVKWRWLFFRVSSWVCLGTPCFGCLLNSSGSAPGYIVNCCPLHLWGVSNMACHHDRVACTICTVIG